MATLNLPDIPTAPMYIGEQKKIMTIEWQEFFRGLYDRVGGAVAPTIIETDTSTVSELYKTTVNYTKRIDELERQIKIFTNPKSYDNKIAELEKLLNLVAKQKSYYNEIDDLKKIIISEALTPDGEPGFIWTSFDIDPNADVLPSADPPAVDSIDNFTFHRYDRATEENVFHHFEIPHDFFEGTSNIRAGLSFLVENPPSGSGDEAVVLGVEYKVINNGGVFSFTADTTNITDTVIIADGQTPLIIQSTAYMYLDTSIVTHDSTILLRFYRDATNPADTYDNEVIGADNDVWVFNYHLEYKRERKPSF